MVVNLRQGCALSSNLAASRINDFAAAYGTAGMKISTSKTEVLHLSRNPVQCFLQVSRES